VKLPPAEQFPDQSPRTAGADTREAREQRDRGLRTAANLMLLLCLKRPDLPDSERQPLELALDLGAQAWQHSRGVLRPPVCPRAATDAASIEVNRRRRRAKTDRLDSDKLG